MAPAAIVSRIFKLDAKLGAAIGALALFAVYLGSTSTIISEVGEWVVGLFRRCSIPPPKDWR